jgi:hypothetical protein
LHFWVFFSPNSCLVKQCVIAFLGVKHDIVVIEYVSLQLCEIPVFWRQPANDCCGADSR